MSELNTYCIPHKKLVDLKRSKSKLCHFTKQCYISKQCYSVPHTVIREFWEKIPEQPKKRCPLSILKIILNTKKTEKRDYALSDSEICDKTIWLSSSQKAVVRDGTLKITNRKRSADKPNKIPSLLSIRCAPRRPSSIVRTWPCSGYRQPFPALQRQHGHLFRPFSRFYSPVFHQPAFSPNVHYSHFGDHSFLEIQKFRRGF